MRGDVIALNGLIVWTTPGITVGLIITDGKVVDCSPYVDHWAMGRDAYEIWQLGEQRNVNQTWIPRGVEER